MLPIQESTAITSGNSSTSSPAQKLPARITGFGAPAQTAAQPAVAGASMPAGNSATASLGYRPNLTPATLSSPVAAATTPAGNASAGPGGPPPPSAAMPSVSSAPSTLSYGQTSQFGPGQDLQSTQILPGQESNRFTLAQNALNTYAQQQLPQFRAQVRDTIGNNAAMGRLGSGMLNTSLGNLDLAQQQDYNNMASNLLNTALGNQITDNANQRQEMRDERAYQTGQGNTAFNQGLQSAELGDQLTNSAFGRALQQEQAGEANNPSNTSLLLSQIFGQQAGQAGQALSGLINSTTQNNALNNQNSLLQLLYGGGGGGTPSPAGGVDQSGLSQVLQSILGGGVSTVPQSVPNYQIPDVVG